MVGFRQKPKIYEDVNKCVRGLEELGWGIEKIGNKLKKLLEFVVSNKELEMLYVPPVLTPHTFQKIEKCLDEMNEEIDRSLEQAWDAVGVESNGD